MQIELLSVVVPVYKQEKHIKNDLENLIQVLENTPYDFEVIVVVDGTTLDKSLEQAKLVKDKRINVLGYPTNHGKGQAVRFGMQQAKGDIVTFIDSGGDINPQGIIMLLEHMKWYNSDIIVGSKLHSASKIKNYPLIRKVFTYGYYLGVKVLFGLRIRDTQTGLKAYKKEVLEKVLPRLVIKRFAFDIEILVVAKSLGFTRIDSAPVEVDMGESIHIVEALDKYDIWGFVVDTIAVWYRQNVLRYYDNDVNREQVLDKELGYMVNTGRIKANIYKGYLSRIFNPQ